jgi:hypothetical protein
MPVRESSQGEPARGQHVLFSGLVQAHTPGEAGPLAEATGETDSVAEQADSNRWSPCGKESHFRDHAKAISGSFSSPRIKRRQR